MYNKTVIITGSARGLGFEMAKCFRKRNFNVIISDISKKDVDSAKKKILEIKGKGKVLSIACDITNSHDIVKLIEQTIKEFKIIDIWINNAGVNQPDKLIWDMSDDEINKMIDIDLKGSMIASKYIMETMIKQNHGAIYTVEGHGSNNAIIPGISVYGTAKSGLTYFTKALAKEAEVNQKDVIVGMLSPGIMITEFLTNSFCNKEIKLSHKNKKIYNILGDYPETVAKYFVNKIISNTNNGIRIKWLTNRKVAWKFFVSIFKKRDFFKEK